MTWNEEINPLCFIEFLPLAGVINASALITLWAVASQHFYPERDSFLPSFLSFFFLPLLNLKEVFTEARFSRTCSRA